MASTNAVALLFAALFPQAAQALRRAIGSLDSGIGNATQSCLTVQNPYDGNETGYTAGKCPALISCIMDTISGAEAAGLSAGTSIAALLPTILALCGAGSLELVQLSFASPVRAISTCLFGIGLPSGLFRQLRARTPTESEIYQMQDPREHQWKIFILHHQSNKDIILHVIADLVIVGLACIMLWRNWVVCSITMVTFRCEYSWLLLCWPMACILWLVLAIGALHIMAEKIEITLNGQPRSFAEILLLPYRTCDQPPRLVFLDEGHQSGLASPMGRTHEAPVAMPTPIIDAKDRLASSEHHMNQTLYQRPQNHRHHTSLPNISDYGLIPMTAMSDTSTALKSSLFTGAFPVPHTAIAKPEKSFTVTIIMRYKSFWGWYEAGLETVAVGIYLYATIVLGSTLFLTGKQSIEYTVLMVLSLSLMRILGSVL